MADKFHDAGAERNMVFTCVKKKFGTDSNFGGSFERFQQISDVLWFNSCVCCHSIPVFQEVKQKIRKKKKVTLVLDLDETLVHSSMVNCYADFVYKMHGKKKDEEYYVYVRTRPFLKEFLAEVSEMFEVIIFTASESRYSAKLLNILDPHNKIFARRLYRESCILKDGRCLKDLTVLGIDLAKVFIIDNNPGVFKLHVNNGIPIKSWYSDPEDNTLMDLLPFLEKLVDVDDVRPIIAKEFGGKN